MQHGDINPLLAGIRNALLKCATSGGELLGFGALKGVDRHGSRVGVEDRLPPMRLSYTLCRRGQPYGVALVTDLSQSRGYCARMAPEDIQHLIDRAIRDHEMRVALWSGLLGALLMAGTWHAIWLCR